MLREAAEYPNSFVPIGPGEERIEAGRYTLCLTVGATVQRQRFVIEELDGVIAEVRATLGDRGRTSTEWEIGSAASPVGLAAALVERGLEWDHDPIAIAMALTRAPPPAPPGFSVRPVGNLAERLAAVEVQVRAFGADPAHAQASRAAALASWGREARTTHGVWRGEEMVAAGSCAPTPVGLALHGGATVPEARGQGAYRALIAARWRHAARIGLPALLTQAGSMSGPILERLGFHAVGRVEMLWDRFGER